MPWRESCAMDERMRFIVDWPLDEWTMTELCERCEISRNTGYKWLGRYELEGPAGLAERSRSPASHGRATPEHLAQAIVSPRHDHPTCGPRKIVAKLKARQPEGEGPAASTAGEILKRAGLVCARRLRLRSPKRLGELTAPQYSTTSGTSTTRVGFGLATAGASSR